MQRNSSGRWRRRVSMIAAGVVIAAAVMVGTPWLMHDARAGSPDSDEIEECDRFMEAYVRSSARKLWRALSRGDYDLRPIELESLEVAEAAPESDQPVTFEVLLEEQRDIAGVVDDSREFAQTYVVAVSDFGPIVVSQTWQPRHLRDQGCKPIASAVQWPRTVASSVDVEPFQYWGLRVAWRIPSVDNASPGDRTLKEVLKQVIVEFVDGPEDHLDDQSR